MSTGIPASQLTSGFGPNLIGDPLIYDSSIGGADPARYWQIAWTDTTGSADNAKVSVSGSDAYLTALGAARGVIVNPASPATGSPAQFVMQANGLPVEGAQRHTLSFGLYGASNLNNLTVSALVDFLATDGSTISSATVYTRTYSAVESAVPAIGAFTTPALCCAVNVRFKITGGGSGHSAVTATKVVVALPRLIENVANAGQILTSDYAPAAISGVCDLGSVDSIKLDASAVSGTVTSFGTAPNLVRLVHFFSGVTLINSANLSLPADLVTTGHGGWYLCTSDGTGKWTVLSAFMLDGGPFNASRPNGTAPSALGELVIERTSNTLLTFKLKGSDGTIRSATLALS